MAARREPAVLVGWLWFLVTLLPVIGLVQVGGQQIADRYSYIPSIGIFVGGRLGRRRSRGAAHARAPEPVRSRAAAASRASSWRRC